MNKIRETFGEIIAIEYAKNWGFAPLNYVTKRYLEGLGVQVIYFHMNVLSYKPNIGIKLFIKKAINYLGIKNYQVTESFEELNNIACPSPLKYFSWKIQGNIWSISNYILINTGSKSVFELEIEKVNVGDAIVASSVRKSVKFPSKLRFDKNLINALFEGYMNYQYGKFLVKQKRTKTVVPSHNVYHHSVRQRAVLNHEGNYLILGKFPFSALVESKTFSPFYPSILPIHKFRELSCDESRLSEEYLDVRISPKSSEVLPYMQVSAYSENDSMQMQNSSLELKETEDSTKIQVCIFLHSFADALFTFGSDSLNDIWHWVTFTIDHLLEISKIKDLNILVKPHPNVFYYQNFTTNVVEKDYFTYKHLENLYKTEPKVSFIDPNTSNIKLTQIKNFIGITHHGNVAPELAYLNQPVIASLHAPWKHCNQFLITWKDQQAYKNILSQIDNYIGFKPCRSSLLKFVYYYYVKPSLMSEKVLYSKKLFQIAFNRSPTNDAELHKMSSQLLEKLENDMKKYKEAEEYLETLITESLDYYVATKEQ